MTHYEHLRSQLDKFTAGYDVSEAMLKEIQMIMARYAVLAMKSPAVAKEAKKVLQDDFVRRLQKRGESRSIEI
jgi:ATP phosphoribosyltransferase